MGNYGFWVKKSPPQVHKTPINSFQNKACDGPMVRPGVFKARKAQI